MVTVEGGDEVLQEQVFDACFFFMRELFSSQMMKNLKIKIILNDDLYKEEDIYGYCEPEVSSSPPRKFEIAVYTKQRPSRIIYDLAHEMVHAKQYATGELVDLINDETRWHGELIDCNTHDNVEYWDAPWEWEAHGRGHCLWAKWKRLRKRAQWRGEKVIGKL